MASKHLTGHGLRQEISEVNQSLFPNPMELDINVFRSLMMDWVHPKLESGHVVDEHSRGTLAVQTDITQQHADQQKGLNKEIRAT